MPFSYIRGKPLSLTPVQKKALMLLKFPWKLFEARFFVFLNHGNFRFSFPKKKKKQEAAAAAELESLRQSDPLNYPRPPPPTPEEEPQPEPMPEAVFDIPDTMYPGVRMYVSCVLLRSSLSGGKTTSAPTMPPWVRYKHRASRATCAPYVIIGCRTPYVVKFLLSTFVAGVGWLPRRRRPQSTPRVVLLPSFRVLVGTVDGLTLAVSQGPNCTEGVVHQRL